MTIEDIYLNLTNHLLKGIMMHSQLSDYFRFLSLEKYACLHDENFNKEMRNYRHLCKNYICITDKLLPETKNDFTNVVPESWYKHKREDVNAETKRSAVKNAMEVWYNWEKETLQLLSDSIGQLTALGEYTTYNIVLELYSETMEEFDKARHYTRKLSDVDYDLSLIMADNEN